MIERAEFIAVVDIAKVEEVEVKTQKWTYRQAAHGKTVELLKGNLPPLVSMHGNESFICAQVRFEPGRFLVFLQRDAGLLVGCNWHFSVRPIRDGKVEWYAPGKAMELSWQPLGAVIDRVKGVVEKPKAK